MGNSVRKIAPGSPETANSLKRQVSGRSARSERSGRSERAASGKSTKGSKLQRKPSGLTVVQGPVGAAEGGEKPQPTCGPIIGDWSFKVSTPRKTPQSPVEKVWEEVSREVENWGGREGRRDVRVGEEGREKREKREKREGGGERGGRGAREVKEKIKVRGSRKNSETEFVFRRHTADLHTRHSSLDQSIDLRRTESLYEKVDLRRSESIDKVDQWGRGMWNSDEGTAAEARRKERSECRDGREGRAQLRVEVDTEEELMEAMDREGMAERDSRSKREREERGDRKKRRGRGELIQPEKGEAWLLSYATGLITDRYYPSGVELGRGNFGIVTIWEDINSSQEVACKTISKAKLTHTADYEDIRREVQVMRHLAGHANVCELHGVYEDTQEIHLVMELCPASGLSTQILQRKRFPEVEAAHIFAQVVEGVRHMHTNGVMHRDLKPENILLSAPMDPCHPRSVAVKLADFGLAVFLGPREMTSGIAGSPYYFAPEVVSGGKYGKEADIWSLGVILYVLLSGMLPFYGESDREIFAQIRTGKVRFSNKYWKGVSVEAKSLVLRLLALEPQWRPTPEEVLDYDWFKLFG